MVKGKTRLSEYLYTYISDSGDSILGTIPEIMEKTGHNSDKARAMSTKTTKRHAEIKVMNKLTGETMKGNIEDVSDFLNIKSSYSRICLSRDTRETETFTMVKTGRWLVDSDHLLVPLIVPKKPVKPVSSYTRKKVVHGIKAVKLNYYWEDMLTSMFKNWR